VLAIDNPAQTQGPVTPRVKIAHSVPVEQLPVELPSVAATESTELSAELHPPQAFDRANELLPRLQETSCPDPASSSSLQEFNGAALVVTLPEDDRDTIQAPAQMADLIEVPEPLPLVKQPSDESPNSEPPTKNGAVTSLTRSRMAPDASTSVLPSYSDSNESGVESLFLKFQTTNYMNCPTRTQPADLEANGAADTVARECFDNLANHKPEADAVAELIRETGPETGCGGQVGEPEGIREPSRRKVLVVDDDLVIRMLLKMGLGAHGYDCVTAEHGKAAQAILQTNRFDLLVVDLLMPVMDGLAFIRWLRQTAQDSTPVLVFTNVDDPKIARDAQACGADSIVCKPVHLRDLVDEMNRLVAVPSTSR
jgi:CheY-like chemotaxis protein